MEQEKRSGVLGGIAKVLNVTGSALVISYDSSIGLIGKTVSKVIEITPALPGKTIDFFAGTKNMFSRGCSIFQPGEKQELDLKIEEYEDKIKAAHYEIGKEGSSADQQETDTVMKLINDVKEYEKEIQRLKNRIVEIETSALEEKAERKEEQALIRKPGTPESRVLKSLTNIIEKSVKQGDFETESDRAIFIKVADDLLDNEMEIRILAASELSKIGNKAALPILYEAVNFNNPYLTSEIINSIINLDDPKSVSLFRETLRDPNYRVRMVSMRGLYKMGDDAETVDLLVNALKDKHPEVRKMAVTFLGWKDKSDAVPGLVQSLQDRDERVRKAAVTSLSNIKDSAAVLPLMRVLADKSLEIRGKALEAIQLITGEEIKFDLELNGQDLNNAISYLKEQYHDERLGKIRTEEPVVEAAAEVEPEAAIAEEEEVEVEPEVAIAEKEEAEVEPEEAIAEEEEVEVEPEEAIAEEEEVEVEPEEAIEEEAEEEEGFSKTKLKKMTRPELVAICEARGITCNDSLIKSEIINMILE